MFNKVKYKQEYNKKHYKTFKVDLTPVEYNLIDTYCKLKKITKANFLRICMKDKGLINFDDNIKKDRI